MKRLSRAMALKIAAILSFLLGVYRIYFSLPELALPSANATTAGDAFPYFVMVTTFVFGIVRLVAADGTWQNQRWEIVLTILANALDIVGAVPVLLFAPTRAVWNAVVLTVLLGLVVIILCLWRDRKAFAL